MRMLESHKVNPANDRLDITVLDEPGAGGACHQYLVTGFDGIQEIVPHDDTAAALVMFQTGPIPETGVNGLTQEVLLAILIDRLEGFQSGKFACEANAIALDHLRSAQEVLKGRTRARMARGVEGTHNK